MQPAHASRVRSVGLSNRSSPLIAAGAGEVSENGEALPNRWADRADFEESDNLGSLGAIDRGVPHAAVHAGAVWIYDRLDWVHGRPDEDISWTLDKPDAATAS